MGDVANLTIRSRRNMYTFLTSNADLQERIIALLRSGEFDYLIDSRNAITVSGPFPGDAYDLLVEQLYDPVFQRWCIVACDEADDIADLRQQLIAEGIPFIEECNEAEHGFVLSEAKAQGLGLLEPE